MAFEGISYDLQLAVGSELIDGFVFVQPDSYGPAGVEGAELQHSFGYMARPIDPERDAAGVVKLGKACNVLYGKDGDDTHCTLGMDPRYNDGLPALEKGETCHYGSNRSATPTFHHVDEDGSHVFYVPVAFDSAGAVTKAHQFAMGLDGNGKPSITLQHSEGMAVMLFEGKAVLRNTDGSVYLELAADGTVFNGNTKLNGSVIAGNVAAPLPFTMHAALTSAISELVDNINAALATKQPISPAPIPVPVVVPPLLASAASVNVQGN